MPDIQLDRRFVVLELRIGNVLHRHGRDLVTAGIRSSGKSLTLHRLVMRSVSGIIHIAARGSVWPIE
jgi:hypothetical protein